MDRGRENSVEFPVTPKAIEQERDRNQNAESLSPKRGPFVRRKIFENLLGMVKSQVVRIWCELVGIVVILFLSANFYYMAHAMRMVEENKKITLLQNNLRKIKDFNISTGLYTTVSNRTEHLTVEQRFGQRKNRLEQECRAKQLVGSEMYKIEELSYQNPNLLYVDSLEVIYCAIPKAGCTNWKKVLLLLSDKLNKTEIENAAKDIRTISGSDAHARPKEEGMNFWMLNKTERMRRLQTYKKFVVVREPFERLLSAYRNKLATDNVYFGKLSNAVHRNMQGSHLRRKRADRATFVEFLEALVDHSHSAMVKNEHWMPYWQLCFPCDINYDYILKLESIQEDSEWLIKKLENKYNVTYPAGYKNAVDDKKLENKLANVPKNLIRAVYKYLQRDYELFGYEKPSFF